MPGAEWRQMLREAWRLQREHFWTSDMAEIDWLAVYARYLPLVDRVSSRSEFSDLIWEMQGELGTSHAYEFGGDYRLEPNYHQGFLGADIAFDAERNGWKITHIYLGDAWDSASDSPLAKPGVNVSEGDLILAINGQKLNRRRSPASALVNQAGEDVALTILPQGEEKPRQVTVRLLYNETSARYREWVESCRQRVHAASGGRVGYLHIPDMMGAGFAEFHRGYLAEVERQGLIVDVRFNRGGHVSALLLEKLARRRIGYDIARWSQELFPYPPESVLGPMVALTNEHAGSDGDIFSHGFKLMKLGPLVGKRTWGGVVGIEPRHNLVDGTVTTQPEFSFWFMDVGWGVENYGTDPDIEVDIAPQDYARGVDTQLERGIEEILNLLEANPPRLPELPPRPSRALPRLPAR
jgi:tricorn protease